MIDANQRWDVQEAIDRVSALAEFRPLWVKLKRFFPAFNAHNRLKSQQKTMMYLVTLKLPRHSNRLASGEWRYST